MGFNSEFKGLKNENWFELSLRKIWIGRWPVASLSEAWLCGRSPGRTEGSKPAGGASISVSCECCVSYRQRSLGRADPSSRGFIPNVLCVCVCPVIRCKNNALHLQWVSTRGQTEKVRMTLWSQWPTKQITSILTTWNSYNHSSYLHQVAQSTRRAPF